MARRPFHHLPEHRQKCLVLLRRANGHSDSRRCSPSSERPNGDSLRLHTLSKFAGILSQVAVNEISPGWNHPVTELREFFRNSVTGWFQPGLISFTATWDKMPANLLSVCRRRESPFGRSEDGEHRRESE